jgi:hypothetical protein
MSLKCKLTVFTIKANKLLNIRQQCHETNKKTLNYILCKYSVIASLKLIACKLLDVLTRKRLSLKALLYYNIYKVFFH